MAAFFFTNQSKKPTLLDYIPKNLVIKTLMFPET
jgi:hypothetical protein